MVEDTKNYNVIITNRAQNSFRHYFGHINANSPLPAKNAKQKVFDQIKSLKTIPNRFSIDERLVNRPKNYRSFSIWSYRIIYRVVETKLEIVIVDIIHTSRGNQAYRRIE